MLSACSSLSHTVYFELILHKVFLDSNLEGRGCFLFEFIHHSYNRGQGYSSKASRTKRSSTDDDIVSGDGDIIHIDRFEVKDTKPTLIIVE